MSGISPKAATRSVPPATSVAGGPAPGATAVRRTATFDTQLRRSNVGLQIAPHLHHASENTQRTGRHDNRIRSVLRVQLHPPVSDPQPLHRRLVVHKRHHDLAVLRVRLLADNDDIAGQNSGVDHAVPSYPKGEPPPVAEVVIYGYIGVEILYRLAELTGLYAPEKRD